MTIKITHEGRHRVDCLDVAPFEVDERALLQDGVRRYVEACYHPLSHVLRSDLTDCECDWNGCDRRCPCGCHIWYMLATFREFVDSHPYGRCFNDDPVDCYHEFNYIAQAAEFMVEFIMDEFGTVRPDLAQEARTTLCAIYADSGSMRHANEIEDEIDEDESDYEALGSEDSNTTAEWDDADIVIDISQGESSVPSSQSETDSSLVSSEWG